MPTRHRLLAIGMVVCALSSQAWGQVETREGIALQNQIAELRQELQTVQATQQGAGPGPQGYPPQQAYPPPDSSGSAGSDTAAQLVVRVSTLEEQNRQLQGRVDDLTNQIQRQHDELTKQIGDLSFKLGQAPASGGDAGEQATASPRLASPAPVRAATPASARRTPELALREGNAALARRDYVAASAAAREALGGGHGATAASAQFLLARSEGGQRQYKEAAADFYQAYAHNPHAPAAPVALLGVVNSLTAMGDNKDACQALAKLQAEFPGVASVKSGAASARKRAACGH